MAQLGLSTAEQIALSRDSAATNEAVRQSELTAAIATRVSTSGLESRLLTNEHAAASGLDTDSIQTSVSGGQVVSANVRVQADVISQAALTATTVTFAHAVVADDVLSLAKEKVSSLTIVRRLVSSTTQATGVAGTDYHVNSVTGIVTILTGSNLITPDGTEEVFATFDCEEIKTGPALEITPSGLDVNLGTKRHQAAAGDHVHANDHPASSALDTDSVDLIVDPLTQAISGNVKLAAGDPGIEIVSGGIQLNSGVPRAGHVHPDVTVSASGFMKPEHLTLLSAFSGVNSVAATYSDTDTIELSKSGVDVTANAKLSDGLKSTALGIAVDYTQVASLNHVHTEVQTSGLPGMMSPAMLLAQEANTAGLAAAIAADVVQQSGIDVNSAARIDHDTRISTNETSIGALSSGLDLKANLTDLDLKADVSHIHTTADTSGLDKRLTCVEVPVNISSEAALVMPNYLRVEMPQDGSVSVDSFRFSENQVTLRGNPLLDYTLKLRVRGAVEIKDHTGGTVQPESPWLYLGGVVVPSPWNDWKLTITDPDPLVNDVVYYLNHADSLSVIYPDYQFSVVVKGNVTMKLEADSADDLQLQPDAEITTILPGSVTDKFLGQFLQIDPVSIDLCQRSTELFAGDDAQLALARDFLKLERIPLGGADGPVREIKCIGNNVWVGGEFNRFNGVSSPRLTLLNSSNLASLTVQPTFDTNGGLTEAVSFIEPYAPSGVALASGVSQVLVGTSRRGYIPGGGKVSTSGGFQAFKVDSLGTHITFDVPSYIPKGEPLTVNVGTRYLRSEELIAIGAFDNGSVALLTPRTLRVVSASGTNTSDTVIAGTERYNSLLMHGNKALLTSHSYSGVDAQMHNEPAGTINPKGAKLLDYPGLGMDSTWVKGANAGTGAGSSCGLAVKGTDSNGDYFVIGNARTGFNSPDQSWNKDEIGNLLLYSEEFQQASYSGVDVWTPIGVNTVITADTTADPNGLITADTIADDAGVEQAYAYQDVTIDDDNTRYFLSIYVLKDSDTARFPGIQLRFIDGTTEIDVMAHLNTQTGAVVLAADSAANGSVLSVDTGNFWRVTIEATNNSTGNVTARVSVHPAYSSIFGGSAEAMTGSSIVWGAQLGKSTWQRDYVKTTTANDLPPVTAANSALFEGVYKVRDTGIADSNWDANVAVSSGHVKVWDVDTKGNVYIGGDVPSIGATATTPNRLYRLKPTGSLDAVFESFNGTVNVARVTNCGRIIAGGEFTKYGTVNVGYLVVLNSDGTIAKDDPIVYQSAAPDAVQFPHFRSKIWVNCGECPIIPKIWDCDTETWIALGGGGVSSTKVPCPVFDPLPPGVASTSGVGLSVPGFTSPEPAMFYTVDGSIPTDQSSLYSGVDISLQLQTTTIKTFSRLQGYKDSDVCSGTFVITPELPCPVFVPGDGAAPPQSVFLSVTDHADAAIYYTSVSGLGAPPDPTTGDSLYSAPIAVNYTTSLKAFAVKTGYKDSAICLSQYQPPVYGQDLPVVEFDPVSASLVSFPVDVSLSVPVHPEATIYYTLDGSTPGFGSTIYTVAVSVADGETIKAFANKAGWNPSTVTSATYQKTQVMTPIITPSGGVVPQTVSIASATAGALIRYTTDGSTPTEASLLYSSPFTVSTASTVKAKAFLVGSDSSDVASATYDPIPLSGAPDTTWFDSDLAVRFGDGADVGDSVVMHSTTGDQKIWTARSIDLTALGFPSLNSPYVSDANKTGILIDSAVDWTGKLIFIVYRHEDSSYRLHYSDNGGESFVETYDFGSQVISFKSVGPNTLWMSSDLYPTMLVFRINRSLVGSGSTKLLRLHNTFSMAFKTDALEEVRDTLGGTYLDRAYIAGGDDTIARLVTVQGGMALEVTRDFGVNWARSNTLAISENVAVGKYATYQVSHDGSLLSLIPSNGGRIWFVKLDMNAPVDNLKILSSREIPKWLVHPSGHLDRLGRHATYGAFNGVGGWNYAKWIPGSGGTLFTLLANGGTVTIGPREFWPALVGSAFYSNRRENNISAYGWTEAGVKSIANLALTSWDDANNRVTDSRFLDPYSGVSHSGSRFVHGNLRSSSRNLVIVDAPWNFRAKFDGTTPVITDFPADSIFLSAALTDYPTADAQFVPDAPMFTSDIAALTANSDAGYTVSAEGETGSNSAFKAFDGDDSTLWEGTADDQWLKIALPAGKAFGALKLAVEIGDLNAWPIESLVLEGSFDNATWDTIVTDTSTITDFFKNRITGYIHLANACVYTYYRLTFGMVSGFSKIKTVEFSEHPVPQLRVKNFESGASSSAEHSRDFTQQAPAVPTFSPASGSAIASQEALTLSTDVRGRIFYTVDGSTPDCSDNLYTGPFNILPAWTVKAFADGGARGFGSSAVGTATYSQAQVATPVAAPTAAAIVEGSTVTLTCATAGASIYYTTDGTTPDATDTLYSAPVSMGALPTTLKAIGIKAGTTSSAVMSEAYTKGVAVTPVADPTAATVALNSTVSLSTVTDGASIYYTDDGTAPDATDNLYSGPITLTALPVTIKAITIKTGLTDSGIKSEAFTQAAAATPTGDPAGPTTSFPDNGATEEDITLATTTPGATILYSVDGSAPSLTYTVPLTITVGTRVRAKATLTDFTDSAEFDITYTRAQLAVPTFTPGGGAGVSQLVLTHAVGLVSIYYTLDSSDPSDSGNAMRFLYSGAIAIGPPVTVKASAEKNGYTTSTVGTEIYT